MQQLLIDKEWKDMSTPYFVERYYDNKLNSMSIFTGYYPSICDLLKDTPRYIDDVINFKQIVPRSLKGVLQVKA